jgi:disulfide bond formation protein DsbB
VSQLCATSIAAGAEIIHTHGPQADRVSSRDFAPPVAYPGGMTLRQIAATGLVASGFALGFALVSQYAFELVPCALCYLERWPYRAGIALGFAGLLLPQPLAKVATWLLLAAYLAAAGSAAVHVGVEQHWWKSPLPECTAPDLSGLSSAARFARMPDRPAKSCEDPDYPIPAIPITMAQGNLIFALAVGVTLTILLVNDARRRG